MRLLPALLVLAATFATTVRGELPPLIDRELLFDDPEISGVQISPDGRHISFLKQWNGTRNIWVKKADAPFASARVVTAETKRPIPGYFWSRDSRFVLWVQDDGGDENYNVHAVDPAASGDPVPPARNVTGIKGVRAMIYALPRSEPDILYVGLNDRDKAWHDLYRVRISTGERTLVRRNTERITGWIFDNKDQLRLATRVTPGGVTELLRVDADAFHKVYECGVFEECSPLRFHKDNRGVYMRTNRGSRDRTELVLLDLATGNEQFVESDPQKRVDVGGVFISEVTDEIISTTYDDDKPRLQFRDKSWEADYNRMRKQLGGREIRAGGRTADERLWIITAYSDADPGETFLFDRKTGKLTLQYKVREKLRREHLASSQPVRYESSDGLEIPGYLTLPKGLEARNLPVIILPHGGPWYRDSWGFDTIAQFLANRGYAVLQPNFRGSTGYGKTFLDKGNMQWGEKMQDDLTWGVKWLTQKGIADPKRVGILGGSYGGYATLAGVAFTPDVYAAAVSIVGPSNLATLLDSIPPYWEAARAMFNARMGDLSKPEDRKRLERQSPLFHAEKIRTPLMVVQGANDPRVKRAESDQIVVALRDRKFPVEYLVAPDEGHGFARPVNNLAMMAAVEKFLAKNLGGRAQTTMTPEAAARLKEITVDPATVTLSRPIDAAAVTIPKIAHPPTPGTYRHKMVLNAGTQTMNIDSTFEVKRNGDRWRVTQKATTPMGDIVDEVDLDGDTLAVLRRNIVQGPLTVTFDVNGSRLAGKLIMQGNEKPLDVDLGGPLFADAAASALSLAALPLEAGYKTSFRTFDVMTTKPKLMTLTVPGSESVTVPAGTFDAWKVEVLSAEGNGERFAVWADKTTRRPVKTAATLPQMGGATLTSELQ